MWSQKPIEKWSTCDVESLSGDIEDICGYFSFLISSLGLPYFVDGKMMNFTGNNDTVPSRLSSHNCYFL